MMNAFLNLQRSVRYALFSRAIVDDLAASTTRW